MVATTSKFQRLALTIATAAVFFTAGCRTNNDADSGLDTSAVHHVSEMQCTPPTVGPEEACYYAKPCYQDLIRCVGAGESYEVKGVVSSVVVGANVSQANTATCQFYGPDAAFAQTPDGCSTNRIWTQAAAPSPGT